MDIPHIVVRKDIAMTGLAGSRRHGFKVLDLIDAVLKFVGWDQTLPATLIGAGCLGSALLGYTDFAIYNLRIDSVFDSDANKIGKTVHGYEIFDVEQMKDRLKNSVPKVGIICVPTEAAQSVADILVSLHIKYIWNFANVCLKVPKEVIVQREVIAGGLAVLSAKIRKAESGDTESLSLDEDI